MKITTIALKGFTIIKCPNCKETMALGKGKENSNLKIPHRAYSDEEIKEIIKMRKNKIPYKLISQKFNRSIPSLHNALARRKIYL